MDIQSGYWSYGSDLHFNNVGFPQFEPQQLPNRASHSRRSMMYTLAVITRTVS